MGYGVGVVGGDYGGGGGLDFGEGVGYGYGGVGYGHHGEVVEVVAKHGEAVGADVVFEGEDGGGFVDSGGKDFDVGELMVEYVGVGGD